MEAFKEFTSEKRSRIEAAIKKAETKTSGEVRVHIEDECTENVLDRAAFIFNELEMDATENRNGVLIYLSYLDHKLAIIGDKNIDDRVPEQFWDSILVKLISQFKTGNYTEGIEEALEIAGNKLAEFFPKQEDKGNELDNQVTFS